MFNINKKVATNNTEFPSEPQSSVKKRNATKGQKYSLMPLAAFTHPSPQSETSSSLEGRSVLPFRLVQSCESIHDPAVYDDEEIEEIIVTPDWHAKKTTEIMQQWDLGLLKTLLITQHKSFNYQNWSAFFKKLSELNKQKGSNKKEIIDLMSQASRYLIKDRSALKMDGNNPILDITKMMGRRAVAQIISIVGHQKINVPRLNEFLFPQARFHNFYNDQEVYMLCSGIRKWNWDKDGQDGERRKLIHKLQEDWFDEGKPREYVYSISAKGIASMYRMLAGEPGTELGEKALRGVIKEKIDEFSLGDIFEILSGLNSLGRQNIEEEFVVALANRVKALNAIEQQSFSTVINELAKLNYSDPDWYDEIIDKTLENTIEEIKEAKKHEEKLSPEKQSDRDLGMQLVKIIQAASQARIEGRADKALDDTGYLKYSSLRERTTILCSIARTGRKTEAMKQLALAIANSEDFLSKACIRDLSLFVLTFGFLFGNQNNLISRTIIQYLKWHKEVDSLLGRSQIFQAMVLTGYTRKEYEEYLEKVEVSDPTISKFQSEAVEFLREKTQDSNMEFRVEERIGSTYVDVLVKGVKFEGRQIVIQLDGVFHYSFPKGEEKQPNMKTQVNTEILQRMGYHVIRVDQENWKNSLEEVVDFLNDCIQDKNS